MVMSPITLPSMLTTQGVPIPILPYPAGFLATFWDESRVSIRSHDDKDSHKGNSKDDNRDKSPPPSQIRGAIGNLARARDSRHHKRAVNFIAAVDNNGRLSNTADASITDPNVFAAQEG